MEGGPTRWRKPRRLARSTSPTPTRLPLQPRRTVREKFGGFEASCFDGHYITGDVSDSDFAAMEAQRRLQFEEDDGNGRGRLALQGAEEGA